MSKSEGNLFTNFMQKILKILSNIRFECFPKPTSFTIYSDDWATRKMAAVVMWKYWNQQKKFLRTTNKNIRMFFFCWKIPNWLTSWLNRKEIEFVSIFFNHKFHFFFFFVKKNEKWNDLLFIISNFSVWFVWICWSMNLFINFFFCVPSFCKFFNIMNKKKH